MSNDKEIRIRAVLDASTFDKGVNEIQEKLKKLTQQQTQGAGSTKALGKDSVLGKYAQQAFGDFSKESQKQLETMYQTQRREAVNQSITMKGKEAELAKMAKMDGEMTKQQKERNENLKKEIELLKEKHRLTLNTAAETQKALDKMKPVPGAGGGGSGAGGPNDGGGSPSEPGGGAASELFKKYLKQMTTAAGAAAIYKGALNTASDFISRDRVIGANNAASFNMGSREMREQFQGRGSRGMFYLPERQRAMQRAATEQGRQSKLDLVEAGGSALAGGLAGGYAGLQGGAMAGAYGGAAIGAMFGGVGALPGSIIGAGIGGIGGMIGGAYLGMHATTNEKQRARLFDQEKYKSIMTKEGLEKYEQNLASEKAKDPRKVMAQEYFEQNRESMASTQKLMGLGSDRELMAGDNVGILQRNMKYGNQYGGVNFNQQTIEQQAQALAGGGAMTEGIRDLSGAAATYNRQFNVSNAGQTMGRMQGNTGANSSLTDMAYQKLLTEAVRLGVDASAMPRELEKMTQMTAELQTAGGVNAEGMTDLFGKAVTGLNDKSLQAAATSVEGFKSTSKESGDWEGQMGYGFMQSDKAKDILGKSLGAKDMNYLNQTSAAELDETGFKRIAAGLSDENTTVSPEQVKQFLTEKDKYKQARTGQEQTAYDELGDFRKNGGDMNSEEGMRLDYNARASRAQSRGGFAQQSQVQQESDVTLQSNVAAGYQPGDFDMAAKTVAGQKSKKEERAAYVEEGAEATGDMARMDALNEQLDALKTAARNHTKYAEEYNKQFELLVTATKTGANAMDSVAAQLQDLDRRIREGDAGSGGVPSGKPPGSR